MHNIPDSKWMTHYKLQWHINILLKTSQVCR